MARVICCELAPVVGELERNLAAASAAVRSAAAAGAEVIVLPELATSGYCFESNAEASSVAIGARAPIFADWSVQARGAVVVAGFAELGSAGRLYNSAVVVDATGVRAIYRKTHLWDSEKLYFTAGDAPPPVLDTAVGRVAVMVCYDLEFPEMARSVALRGADLLAVPTNWPWVARPVGMPAPEVVIAMAAARVNRMPIACCDRRGTERGQRWNQASTIVGADGWPVATADAAGFAVADLDLLIGRDKRVSPGNHLHEDRRTDLY